MKLHILFILLITSYHCKSEISVLKHESAITNITLDQFKNQGDDVELSCTVNNPDSLSVLWSKTYQDNLSDQTVLTVNNVMLVPDSRYSISTDKGTYTLKVSLETHHINSTSKKITINNNYVLFLRYFRLRIYK